MVIKYAPQFSRWLKEERRKQGVKRTELEEATGISQYTFKAIENQERNATLNTALLALDALGYHLEVVANE